MQMMTRRRESGEMLNIVDAKVAAYGGDAGDAYIGEIVVVELVTEGGLTGTGFASAPRGVGHIFRDLIANVLLPQIIGQNAMLHRDLWDKMFRTIPRRGGEGIVRVCISALDFAIWDLKARASGATLAQLIGGHRDKVPTYINCAHHMPPDALAERAASYVRDGHRALKIRGARSHVTLQEADARVAAVREAIGEDVLLMVDVNGTWDADTAIQQLRKWERHNLFWLEEPVQPEDFAGYRAVRERAGGVHIAGGEQHTSLHEYQALIGFDGIDIAQPNAAICGGITEWMRIHDHAVANGRIVSPWNLQPIHIHLACGLQSVKWLEYFKLDNALLGIQTLLFSGPRISERVEADGVYLEPPEAPGLGLEIDPEAAEKYRLA
ncbi:MAG TPA: mandelate racemase [Citreicella sp.]|nr:mandelate racemase [Citreicella sp.]